MDLEEVSLRRELERRFAGLLQEHGMDHLDLSELRSKHRLVTQAISRFLHAEGAAGIVYRSNLDNGLCLALFERRAKLVPAGEPEPLSGPLPELDRVCLELGLIPSAL